MHIPPDPVTGEKRLAPLLQEEADLLEQLHPVLWVWEDYRDATRGRGGDMSPKQLSHEMLVWWQWNREIRAEQWQITALLGMDELYLSELMAPLKDDDKESKDGRAS